MCRIEVFFITRTERKRHPVFHTSRRKDDLDSNPEGVLSVSELDGSTPVTIADVLP